MTLKVKEVTDIVEKSVQEVENELLQKHEEKQALQDANAESRVLEKESTITKEVVGEQEIKKELQEKEVLDYLGNRYGKEINSFDDLVTEREIKEELPEDVAAYLKYKKETGRGVEDYVKLNQDFDGMNPDVLLSEYFLATDEAIDPEDVESLMEDFIYDEDVDDESDIKKKKLAKKRIVRKATKYFNDQKDTFNNLLSQEQLICLMTIKVN